MYINHIIDYHINMKKNKYIYLILIPIILLNIISLSYLHNTIYFKKQLIFIILSFICLFIFSKININLLLKLSPYLYLLSLILLTIVLIFGKEINGSKAWLHIFGISIQPSEITKIALSLYSIKILSENKNLLHLLIITIIPSILTFLEPDTGAIIIYIIIFLSLLYFYKIKKKHIILSLSIISIFIIANIFLYYLNKDLLIKLYGTNLFYRIDRIIMFKNQNNIQSINSLISIGSHNLIYIPENHNDFIFASIISKYSPIIFLLITSCYLLIFYYYIKNIKKKKSTSNIINFIILNMLLFQTFYNILMNLSLVPIIGIPIPFLSYGGSYLLILYTLIGISINLNNKKVV